MNRFFAQLLVVLLTVVGCASDARDLPRTRADALRVPSLTPVPNGWSHDTVDLMAADAMAECSWWNGYPPVSVDPLLLAEGDRLHNDLRWFIGSSPSGWFALRADPTKNTDPSTGKPAGVQLRAVGLRGQLPRPYPTPGYDVVDPSYGESAVDNAQRLVMRGSQYLCIAQRLRAVAPGAAGGEALLLETGEQLKLASMIRRLTQMSILHFDRLAVAMAAPVDATLLPPFSSRLAVPVIQDWARNVVTKEELGALADDFLAAIQLHTIATEELFAALARQASGLARRPYDSPSASSDIAADAWGAGSWRMRALDILHGSRAELTEADEWGVYYARKAGVFALPPSWPEDDSGYVSREVRDPLVWELMRLATQANALSLKLGDPVAEVDGGSCSVVDRVATAARLYRIVEAAARTSECAALTAGGTCPVYTASDITLSADDASMTLWRKHRVNQGHARVLADVLADTVGRVCVDGAITFLRGGAQDILGDVRVVSGALDYPTETAPRLLELNSFTAFAAKSLLQREPSFAFLAPLLGIAVPSPAIASEKLFPDYSYASDVTWSSGPAVAMLVATRQALTSATEALALPGNTPSEAMSEFFSRKDRILEVVDAAVGPSHVSIQPEIRTSVFGMPELAQVEGEGGFGWVLEVAAPVDDAFWAAGSFSAFATRDPRAGALALHPTSKLFGADVAGLAVSETPNDSVDVHVVGGKRIVRFHFTLPGDPWNVWSKWTFVAKKAGTPDSYRLLIANQGLRVDNYWIAGFPAPVGGGFYATGGTLNVAATTLMTPSERNPAEAKYDAFGYPVSFTPTLDPLTTSGAASTSAERFLTNAKVAATDATLAVEQALNRLTDQLQDEAQEVVAATRSSEVAKLEQRALCGDASASCAVETDEVNLLDDGLKVALGTAKSDCSNPALLPGASAMACIAYDVVSRFDYKVILAKDVIAKQSAPTPPTFSEYGGGTLQQAYLQQWQALTSTRTRMRLVFTQAASAAARAEVGDAAAKAVSERIANNCSAGAFRKALAAGFGVSVGAGSTGLSASVSFSFGPFIAQHQKCDDLMTEMGPAAAGKVSAMADAILQVSSTVVDVAESAARLDLAAVQTSKVSQDAKLAKARAGLEGDLVKNSLRTSFGLYRRYRSYDLWRAKALLENARRYAVVARRSIESRFAVNLSRLSAAEPFTAAPATWADEVYQADLNLPAAVGLSVGPREPAGIYPAKLSDYVANLSRFVDGYGIARPTAVAQKDVDIVSLPGPLGWRDAGSLTSPPLDGSAYSWAFRCADGCASGGNWCLLNDDKTGAARLTEVCGVGKQPTHARLTFYLDPWARLNGSIGTNGYANRHNARWLRFALNVVGTGVVDCTKASDPLTCYSAPYLRYSATHTGPAWVTNYEQEWRGLDLPQAYVEGAKAVAAEMFLDPLTNGFGKPFVDAVARDELTERPFGGAYEIQFEVTPEFRLERVERLQLLFQSTYWTRPK